MVQWVKDPATVAPVTMEAQVQSPARSSRLGGLTLPDLWHRAQLQLRFHPWPRNVHMMPVWPKGKKKNEILPLATTWMDLGRMMLSKISQRKTNTEWCGFIRMWNLKNKTNENIKQKS